MAVTVMLNELNRRLHESLGIPDDYGRDGNPPYFAEATELVDVGPNLVGRMQRLTPEAAARWQQMVEAAGGDGIRLLIVSGFRDAEYQAGLIQRKLEAGEAISDILTVNAAPGFSPRRAQQLNELFPQPPGTAVTSPQPRHNRNRCFYLRLHRFIIGHSHF